MKVLRYLFCNLVLAVVVATASGADRIISLSPSTTEILYGIGAFPQVVAVSQYCTYPKEVSKLPRVGTWETSNPERIVALHPTLVVFTRSQKAFLQDKLDALSLKSIAVPSETVADILESIRELGAVTGHANAAASLVDQTRHSLEQIRSATKNRPPQRVLLVISRMPGSLTDMYVATGGSFLAELLEIAGGKSVAPAAPGGYAKLSKEALVGLDPDIIIDAVHNPATKMSENPVEVWNDLPTLKAVRGKHVVALDDEFLVHPSQFIAHTAKIFLRILHPDITGVP